MKPFLFFIAVLFFIAGCQQNQDSLTSVVKRAENVTRAFKKKPDEYYYQYDSSKSDLANYDEGWIDTFSVNGVLFQLLSNPDTTGRQLEMQVYKNGIWQHNFDAGYGTFGIDHKSDINNDGFSDYLCMVIDASWVNLFDKNYNQFSEAPLYISYDFELIDSTNNIYYQVWMKNKSRSISDLYRFIGNDQYYMYRLKQVNQSSTDSTLKMMRLYRCADGKKKDTLFMKNYKLDIGINAFNYKKFWEELIKNKQGTK
jgi:hypothetical protein